MDLPCFRRADSEDRGRHLRATRFISKNELVFCERPLLSLQSVGNAHGGALACRNCRAFVGGPNLSIALASGRVDRAQAFQHWEKLQEKQELLIPCRHGCGEVYCSDECEQDHWCCGGHSLLCTGKLPEPSGETTHPLLEFKIHAVQNNEIFLMVADMVASLVSQRIFQLQHGKQNNAEDQRQRLLAPYLDFTLVPWWTVAITPLLTSPMGFAEASELERVLKRLCDESSSLLRRALEENCEARRALEDFPDLCTTDFFGKVIGSFEQNAIGIRRRHPLCQSVFDKDFRQRNRLDLIKCMERAGMIGDEGQNDKEELEETIESLVEGKAESGLDKTEQETSESDQNADFEDEREEEWDYTDDEIAAFLAGLEIDDCDGTLGYCDNLQNSSDQEELDVPGDDLDALFTPMDGTAMYSTACKMNHSCDPNVVVIYKCRGWGSDHPVAVHCIALRDILPGEELCISYIQSDEPLEVRQKAIANYGFSCGCERCESEANGLDGGQGIMPSTDTVDTEDLFGDDDESDGSDEGSGIAQAAVATEENGDDAGERALQARRAFLDNSYNSAPAGAIPLKTLAAAASFVVQVGACATLHLAQEPNLSSMVQSLRGALEGVQERDLIKCKSLGSASEEALFRLLEKYGSWPHIAYREAHGCGAVASAIGYAHEGSFISAQRILDKASILGLPRKQIEALFCFIEYHAAQVAYTPIPLAFSCVIPDYRMAGLKAQIEKRALSNPIQYPVSEETRAIELGKFEVEYTSKSRPVVLRSFAAEWAAVTEWRHVHNIVRDHGHRLVPIEVGSMMESEGIKEKLMTFRQFASSFLEPSCQKDCWTLEDATSNSSVIAYLAQHPLLDQIPQLRKEVHQSPRLCGESGPTHVNMWIGTGGTRTPLHFDTYDNLFVQIVGAKIIRIYGAEETKNLYVVRNGRASSNYSQGNMSEVDCEMESFEEAHPMARDAKYLEVLLLPGDCLFIPARAWHYVRGLSTSISVNYWF